MTNESTARATGATPIGCADVVKLSDEHERIARKIATHYAAAHFDYAQASWDWVGLRGESIKIWREAYGEGIKDMSNAILASVDPSATAALKQLVERLFKEETASLHREAIAEKPCFEGVTPISPDPTTGGKG